jgi:hypothetical protein
LECGDSSPLSFAFFLLWSAAVLCSAAIVSRSGRQGPGRSWGNTKAEKKAAMNRRTPRGKIEKEKRKRR